MPKQLILCDCLGSQTVASEAFANLDGVTCSKIHTSLCTAQAGDAANAISDGNAIIACAQEQERFSEIAADLGAPEPTYVDIRDRAGWSDEGADAGPKMAALVAETLRKKPPVKTFDVVSEGLCLILGPAALTLDAAAQLAPHLSVTVLMEAHEDIPQAGAFDVIKGRLKRAAGALGAFTVEFDALQVPEPGGRLPGQMAEARDNGRSECDIILDLRGETPLFPAPEKREGYLRADPGSASAVQQAILDASHLVGTFEKPIYLSLNPHACAHSRAQQAGCSKCLDNCPTSAITSAGDHVDIDPMICAGCGTCAALCPSGAITYEDPAPDVLFGRMANLASAYTAAGGFAPRLLVHDRSFGSEIISLAARFGRGLPADVIPVDLERVSGFGHAEMVSALALGFSAVDVLLGPTTERDVLIREHALASALAGDAFPVRLIDPTDPEQLSDMLYGAETAPAIDNPILPLGDRRQVTRLSVKALRGEMGEPIPLPANAPYGAVVVDTDACTLCLSCASLCPAGALGDNPDMPQLRFQEDACLQCGLCTRVCPENAITLLPQLDTSDRALSQKVVHEEEPFACIECGKLFGVKSTIEKIVEKLEGKHAMFANSEAANLIKMCDDCRVNAQFHSKDNPFAAADRPNVRTTEDYLSKRRDH